MSAHLESTIASLQEQLALKNEQLSLLETDVTELKETHIQTSLQTDLAIMDATDALTKKHAEEMSSLKSQYQNIQNKLQSHSLTEEENIRLKDENDILKEANKELLPLSNRLKQYKEKLVDQNKLVVDSV